MLQEDDYKKNLDALRKTFLASSSFASKEDCRFDLDIDRELVPDMFPDEIIDWLLSDDVEPDSYEKRMSATLKRINEMKAEFLNWRELLGYSGFVAKLFGMVKNRSWELSFLRNNQPFSMNMDSIEVEQIRKMRVVSETLALKKKTFPFSENQDEQVAEFFPHYGEMNRMLLFNSDIENEIKEAMNVYFDDAVFFSKIHDLWERSIMHAGSGFMLHLDSTFLFDPDEPFHCSVVEDIGHALGLDDPIDAFAKGVDFSDITRGWKDPRFVDF